MKYKQLFLLTLLMLVGLSVPVLSEDLIEEEVFNPAQQTTENPAVSTKNETSNLIVIPPKWTDFCETGYENAVYKDRHDVFDVFSFVKSERIKKKYWAERRVSFEKYLKSCNALSDEAKATCYAELKKSEEQKNDLYKLQRKQLLYESNVDIHRR